MTDDRRRSVRLLAGWHALYRLDEHTEEDGYHCRVIDVSRDGAALELFGPGPVEAGRIYITLQADFLAGQVEFAAVVRNMGAAIGGGPRVGVEWQQVTHDQAALINSLLKLTYQQSS
jgi:PilZ domain